ncbi:radical SAM protein [Clostridium magnum]|uniref:radical SAM protein n=1 Tax=Clostridium magnum TaxID=33954 RepID=UPI000916E347|nr:radical SAM protein [Clostridium magnum]SHI14990.1 hypothetical protein SAMN02745944_02774 [Clostridium magnum DSM 2767]
MEYASYFSRIIFSIDGCDSETHDKIRGKKGTFATLLSLITTLNKSGNSKIRINTVITKLFLDENYCKKIVRVIYNIRPLEWCLIQFHPAIKKKSYDAYSVTEGEFESVVNNLKNMSKGYTISILKRSIENYTISLSNIVLEIRNSGQKCFVNYLEGEPDLILKENVNYFDEYVDFDKKFLKKVNKEDNSLKEMLWYYIMKYPSSVQVHILKNYQFEPGEPSWLVRRAIGSVLSELSDFDGIKKKQILYLLKSDNWMLQCIGLIASRNLLDSDLVMLIKESILADINKPMDLIWLANLYLTDSDNVNIEESLSSKLGNTAWGIIDIWKRYIEKIPYDKLWKIISKKVPDAQLLSPLITDLIIAKQFMGNSEKSIPLLETKLVKHLYKQSKRGRTKNVHKKWLISLLYGSWRDQISLNLYDYFDNNINSTISYEMQLAKDLPRVEMRMAIFQMMNNNEEIFKEYYKSLEWGLADVHPWVRREAIKVYGLYFNKYIESAFEDKIDRSLYPGLFDMLIEAERFGYSTSKYIKKYELTKNEINAIKKYQNS